MSESDSLAILQKKDADDKVHCLLCGHRCVLAEGQWGVCGVRHVRAGALRTLTYGRPVALAVDPIEKKPLFQFHPGSTSFSLATFGCNFHCRFCQNHTISQVRRSLTETRYVPPEAIVAAAAREGCRSISYTYTEPTIFAEYACDIGQLARAAGLANVFVSNGYMTPEAIERFSAFLDAANIDLKSFSDATYRTMTGGRLEPVLETLRLLRRTYGLWVEVTTLVVPGMNDSEAELRAIAGFLASELGPEVPWHVSRFHPDYQLRDRGPTPPDTLRAALRYGREAGLRYVYVGNLPGDAGESTHCPGCGRPVIRRLGFQIADWNLRAGCCGHCGTAIDGVGLAQEGPPAP